jgi:DNA-binding PadR family transcriptional regulator
MGDNKLIGSFEELVLLATSRLGDTGYGAKIRQTVGEALGKSVSIGAIYATLDRLERKKLISSWQGEATPERGNRAKRYFKIENAGRQALREAQEARKKLSAGLGLDPVGGIA